MTGTAGSLLVLLAAYLIGSLPVGVWVGSAFGFDPRTVGSGNVGMTNVARAGGKWPAALTFGGDFLKGLQPILAGRALGVSPFGLALIGLAAFLGAIYSIFLGFAGGRGVSSGLGIWLGIAPPIALLLLGVFVVVLGATRIVSVASMSAAVALPIALAVSSNPGALTRLGLAMAVLVLWRHRENLQRLMHGTEPAFTAARDARSADLNRQE